MHKPTHLLTVCLWSICFSMNACSMHQGDKPNASMVKSDLAQSAWQNDTASTVDSMPLKKDELAKVYTQAIAAFIKGAYQHGKTTFDTLYFGKHVYGQPDDFPDIQLPEAIEHVQVRLVTPEMGQQLQAERRSLVYVNMMGWIDTKRAEFILVVFSNGAAHQYDYYINYNHDPATTLFELDTIAFEDYAHLKGQQPERLIIYAGGKYIEDK